MISIVTVIKEEIFREGLNYLINSSGFCCCHKSFPDYNSFEEYLSRVEINVILFDVDINFNKALEIMNKIKLTSHNTVIIALSGNDYEDRVRKSFLAGADGFLMKNISHEKLLEAIRDACAGGAPISSQPAKKIIDYFHKQNDLPQISRNYDLSPREKEVVAKLVEGKTMMMVAKDLSISIDTVRFHSKNIYRKLKVRNQAELVAKTLREKLI